MQILFCISLEMKIERALDAETPEDHYEYEIFSILSIADAWTSLILAGNGITIVILLRVLARIS